MIRAKAVCLFRHGNELLLTKGHDPAKDEYYLIPVGGGIEFGETSEQAVTREVWEETSQKIHTLQLLGVLENLFIFDGVQGHEIVFVYEAQFTDLTAYQQTLHGYESNNVPLIAEWLSKHQIEFSQYPVYPKGIERFL